MCFDELRLAKYRAGGRTSVQLSDRVELNRGGNFRSEPVNVDSDGPMPSNAQLEGESRPEFSLPESLPAEVLDYWIQCWRLVTWIPAQAFLAGAIAPALPAEAPPDQARKFKVIEGGRS